jgi:hypothetical protein
VRPRRAPWPHGEAAARRVGDAVFEKGGIWTGEIGFRLCARLTDGQKILSPLNSYFKKYIISFITCTL